MKKLESQNSDKALMNSAEFTEEACEAARNAQETRERRRALRIAIHALGCPKNLVDSECMSGQIAEASYGLTDDETLADGIIVNTCAFIQSAKEEAIAAILHAAEYKTRGRCRALIVAGCLAQRYADEIRDNLPEVDAILGVSHYIDAVPVLDRLLLFNRRAKTATQAAAEAASNNPGPDEDTKNQSASEYTPVASDPRGTLRHLNGKRLISTGSYAYLKISEGCNHRCAYCAIPSIRGPLLSRPVEAILKEAAALRSGGIAEVILVAQDTSAYGMDFDSKRRFPELLAAIAQLNFPRVRFLYGYADGMSDEMLEVMSHYTNIAPYFDLPIQHASNRLLKKMCRSDTCESLSACFRKIRDRLPNAYLRTSLIVGLPGETDEDFQLLLHFIQEIQFDNLGCFVFSPEEGTAAYAMPDQVPLKVAEKRRRQLMECQKKISAEKLKRRLGQVEDVLIESISDDGLFYVGRGAGQAPDIDSVTSVLSQRGALERGKLYPVRLIESRDYELIGVCESEFAK